MFHQNIIFMAAYLSHWHCCLPSVGHIKTLFMKVLFINKQFIIVIDFHQHIEFKCRFQVIFFAVENMSVECISGDATQRFRDMVVCPWSQTICLPYFRIKATAQTGKKIYNHSTIACNVCWNFPLQSIVPLYFVALLQVEGTYFAFFIIAFKGTSWFYISLTAVEFCRGELP